MARGGARNRSGPQADPSSGRSDRRGLKFTALPASGYDGEVPEWPLPDRLVWDVYFEDKKRVRELERLLGKKTMEVEILKEAIEIAREKKLISRTPLPWEDGSR